MLNEFLSIFLDFLINYDDFSCKNIIKLIQLSQCLTDYDGTTQTKLTDSLDLMITDHSVKTIYHCTGVSYQLKFVYLWALPVWLPVSKLPVWEMFQVLLYTFLLVWQAMGKEENCCPQKMVGGKHFTLR